MNKNDTPPLSLNFDESPIPRNVTKAVGTEPNVLEYQQRISNILSSCHTRRDVQEIEVDTLAECALVATEIYKEKPCPDNAYQLAALTSAHRIALNQLEKMHDPEKQLEDTEDLIRNMFTELVKAMIFQIDRTKQDFLTKYPGDKSGVNEMFTRMVASIQPESQNIYDGFRGKLKKSLGFK
jgi:hypothetical protein